MTSRGEARMRVCGVIPACALIAMLASVDVAMGTATIVAILSERRVQILDLPDSGLQHGSGSEIISRLNRWMNELRVPGAGSSKLQPSNWSFDIKTYSITQ